MEPFALKHLRYKTGYQTWEDHPHFRDTPLMGMLEDNRKDIYIAEPWDPPDRSRTRNLVLLVAGQQSLGEVSFSRRNIVTGQRDWNRKASFETEPVEIEPWSVAGVIMRYPHLFGFTESDTCMALLFDADYRFAQELGNKRRMVRVYAQWLLSKAPSRRNIKYIYLAGASRGGALATAIAQRLFDFGLAHLGLENARVIVGSFDGVADAEQGELGTCQEKVWHPRKSLRWCWRAHMSPCFAEAPHRVRLLQISGGDGVGLPGIRGFCVEPASTTDPETGELIWYLDFRWVDHGHKEIGQVWHDDTTVAHLQWLMDNMRRPGTLPTPSYAYSYSRGSDDGMDTSSGSDYHR